MYHYENNPILKGEILIYCNDKIACSINMANYDTDQEAYDFAIFLCSALNSKE